MLKQSAHQINSRVQNNADSLQSNQLKSQMSVFLSLLQKSIDSEINYNKNLQESIQQKLSTILSASQQNTSGQAINRYNHNSEKNSTCVFFEKYFQTESCQQYIMPPVIKDVRLLLTNTIKESSSKLLNKKSKQCYLSSDKQNCNFSISINQEEFMKQCQSILNNKQIYLLDKFRKIIKKYAHQLSEIEQNKLSIQNRFEKLKLKNEQLTKILLCKNQKEKKLIEQLQYHKKTLQEIDDQNMKLINQNKIIFQQLQNFKKQNSYLKQLILLANKNYQSLEKKYSQLENKCVSLHLKTETTNQSKSSLKESVLIVKSQQNRYKLVSPKRMKSFQKQHKNKDQINQSYRKIFMKTLKSIKK